MNEKIGNLSFPPDQESQFLKPYSEQTSQIVDEEVRQIVKNAFDKTYDLLVEQKEKVQALAERLLEIETVSHDEIKKILGERPFKNPEYLQFLQTKEATEPITKVEDEDKS